MKTTQQENEWVRVSAQQSRRAKRWAYVIDEPGYMPFVSRHIFHSREAALAAGRIDAGLTHA